MAASDFPPIDIDRVTEILRPVSDAWTAGTLTKETYFEAWRALEELLGNEPDGMEALITYGEDEWLRELGVIEE